MKLRHISIALALAAFFPLAASALSISDIQQQIGNLLAQVAQLQGQQTVQSSQSTSAMPTRICPQIMRTLSRGARGSDVASLQAYLGVSQTGYFGPQTAAAVANFQASEGLSQVGIVGPATRAVLARRCGNPNPPVCTMMARLCPAGYHNGGWCNPDCIPNSTSVGAPTISGLDAPTSLSVGASGTWTVHASSPNVSGAQLRYSVVWGDETIYPMPMMSTASNPTVQTSATFTHTYSQPGTYMPIFTVSNDSGSAQTSASVVVGGQVSGTGVRGQVTASPTCPVESYPPNPNCAPRPVQTAINVYQNGSFLVQTMSDANGYFSASLSPGAYELRANEGNTYPRCAPVTVVVSNGFTTANISCDTGIR